MIKLKEKRGETKGIHVYICITHTFDYINTTFFDLMLGMKSKYTYSIIRTNMLPIERNRTHLTNMALKDPTCTHCLYIDTDIVPNDLNFLDIMVSYDLPILGLLCTKKIPPYEPIIYKKDVPEGETLNNFWIGFNRGDLVEVDATGTGCLLVKREVFENMPQPYFKFISSYTHDVYQSEDIYFIEAAKKLGYKTYVDTGHTCKHYGPIGFGLDNFYELEKRKNGKN